MSLYEDSGSWGTRTPNFEIMADYAASLPALQTAFVGAMSESLSSFSGIALYLLLLAVATVIAGCLWRLCCKTCCFVADLVVPLLKVVLIVGLWIVFILLVNKVRGAAGACGGRRSEA